MEDLMWIDADSYLLIIYNYKKFMNNDEKTKKIIIEAFNDSILPWCDSEVEKYCVGGSRKDFNVLLVD